MKRIVLTQGKYALVDDEDFERLNRFKWYANKSHQVWYARRAICINGKKIMLKMHHEIIGHPLKGFEIDHRNGRGLDNQRHNLRHVTRRQNCQNLHNRSRSSEYPGIYWHKGTKKWMARIVISRKCKYLGLFVDEAEAFGAYKQAVNAIGEEVLS